MSMIESVVIPVVAVFIFFAVMLLLYHGENIATTKIIKDQKVCVKSSSSGVEFSKCFKLVEVK